MVRSVLNLNNHGKRHYGIGNETLEVYILGTADAYLRWIYYYYEEGFSRAVIITKEMYIPLLI